MTPYTGYQPKIFLVQPFAYGRWITGLAADDGDLDDAAHIMALAAAAVDDLQFLGHRTIDFIGGFSRQPLADVEFLSHNAFGWEFGCRLALTHPAMLHVHKGGVLRIGKPGDASGVGKILVDAAGTAYGSEIRAQNGAPIAVYGSAGKLACYSGAELHTDSASPFKQYGPHTKLGAEAHTVPRRLAVNNDAGPVTVHNTEAWDRIVCTSCTTEGDPAHTVDRRINLDPPADGTPLHITLQVCVQGGMETQIDGATAGLLVVFTNGVLTMTTRPATVSSGGHDYLPRALSITLECQSAGGASRKWVPIASD